MTTLPSDRPCASAEMSANSAETLLADIRTRIDAVDEQIVGLIQARQALSASAAAGKVEVDQLKIRPAREAHIIDRLRRRGGTAAADLVERIWRELLADGLSRQSPFALAVCRHPDVDAVGVAEAARLRFGGLAPMDFCASAQSTLDRAHAGRDIAIMPLQAREPWWRDVSGRIGLRAFSVLHGVQGSPVAVALARIDASVLEDAPCLLVVGPAGLAGETLARTGEDALWRVQRGREPPGALVIGGDWPPMVQSGA